MTIPPTRQLKKLGELGNFIRGVSYQKPDLLITHSAGCITLLRANNIQNNELNLSELQYLPEGYTKEEQIVQANDILFCMSSGSSHLVGKNILLPKLENYSFGAFCSIYRGISLNIDINYLSNYLQSNVYFKYITNIARGAGINNLRGSDLENFQIPLPPLPTQHAIVARLDEASAIINSAKSDIQDQVDALDVLWQSSLSKVFDNEKYEIKKLNDVFDIRDGTHDSPKFYNNGYPLITSKNLKDDGLETLNVKYVSKEDYIAINQRSKVDKGDLLFAMIGTIGSPTIIKEEPNFAIKNVALFKRKTNESTMEYLRYFLLSQKVIAKMTNESKGATQKFVGLGYLRNFSIPLPPLPIQHQIVSHLDELSQTINTLKALYKQQLIEQDALRASILDKAFRGELVS